jgi:putative hydrolase of the HAD superfamily
MITSHFNEIIDILDVSPFCKPMIESFQIALKKLNVLNVQNILLLDDNIRNIQMAEKLGMQTVWVTENNHFQNYEGKQIKKIEDLLNIYPEITSGQVV